MISIQEMAKLVCGRPLTEDEMITNGFYTCFGKNIISSKYGMYWGNIESTLDTNSFKKKFVTKMVLYWIIRIENLLVLWDLNFQIIEA